MGANLTTVEIVQKMNEVVDKVLSNLKSWDSTLESGIKIVEVNEMNFDELKTLNLLLKDPAITYDEDYLQKLNEVLYEHQKLIVGLKVEQERLVLLMEQLNKKDHVINSYISVKKDPVFIDKDIR